MYQDELGGILHRESKRLFLKMSFAYGLDNNRTDTELSGEWKVENTKNEERKGKKQEKYKENYKSDRFS